MRIEALIIHSGGRIWFLIDILDEAAAPRRQMVIMTAPRASCSHGQASPTDGNTGQTEASHFSTGTL